MARLFVLFIVVSLGLLYAKALGLAGRRTDIRPRIEWLLDWQAKLAAQRANLTALVVLIIFGTLSHQLPRGLALPALIGAALSLALPMRYGLSEEGVTINRRLLRNWTEFDAYELNGRRLVLRGGNRLNFLVVYIPRQGIDKNIVKFVKARLVPALSAKKNSHHD